MRVICAVMALFANSVPRNIDPQEQLRYFSWLGFALIALLYSALVFMGELSKDGPSIFSSRNARPVLQVLILHFSLIMVLFLLVRIGNQIVPIMPYWMTDTFKAGRGARLSIADLVFIAIAGILVLIERVWLYVKSASR